MTSPKKVLVMGGGTGTFPVVQALKHQSVQLSCVIAVSDSGGSTGRIRDEFGFPPVGDLRQALAALAESRGEEWIRKILLYRFEKGEGLKGHNLGNLILTALQDMTGDTAEALQIAQHVFRIHGEVIPVTPENVNLEICYADGTTAVGEHLLDADVAEVKKIDHVQLVPPARVHPRADRAIRGADVIVIGPGDYYASLMATLVPDGVKAAFHATRAKVVYIINLMTRFTQTHDMTAAQHLAGIEQAIGRSVDHVILNAEKIPSAITELYADAKEFPVADDLGADPRVIRASILSEQVFQKSALDTTHRSLLRHDAGKLQKVLAAVV